ncbi:uncharacterized protein ANIA_11204 [Aspergillus nidulans FGSC A4]|uniref:Uncharacterized protein n=1 Tax=Emericella nidulans (strain FGSC A4 / ATCC 38163 / CBS 112.46 / NRRL 194 / M139) TaxID=227321 RepID=C8VFC3_EMENI|nr:hypothetical protein [Aspergillus nidulans FGSC A4]XP_050468940.1 hypothetical protein [Aspergillus nidulans FGSC A4]CBF81157.1 TPA: conserved hypothetical protein [Aspergillus nidulans FGSC A4]CBF87223.1 TPA: conserved hypothetical protein [Aspergillus nidulans FGSC A4]
MCYGSFAYTRTLDLSDSAKACAVLKAVSHLQDFLTTTILLSPFFFSDSFLGGTSLLCLQLPERKSQPAYATIALGLLEI